MNIHWAKNFTGDVCIIYYDDMVANVEGTLRKTLKFIDFPIDEVSAKISFALYYKIIMHINWFEF